MTKLPQIFLVGLCFLAATAYAGDDTPLHDAARAGDKAKVEALLAQGADVNAKEKNGWTPLHWAVRYARKDLAELLLAKGANVNAKNKEGLTPLHWSVNMGDKVVTELLLAKGADVNAKDNDGRTPLLWIAQEGNNNKDFAELLLAKGAEVNAKDKAGETPLHWAAYKDKKKDIIKLLLAKGADVNAKDKSERTPLDWVAFGNNKDNADLLKEHIAITSISAHTQSPREQLKQMVEQLQKSPTGDALREKIIKLAQEVKPPPAVSADAEKFEGRAQYAFRNAKSEIEFLDAAREYLKAVEAAPWVAGYYHDLCVILEKANHPAEAARACKLYLTAAPQASDAGDVRKRVAGLEYALERERSSVVNRGDCANATSAYEGGAKVAQFGNQKLSVKLISVLYGGVWRNQMQIQDITTKPSFGQRHDLDPVDKTFQIEDRIAGTPYFRLTIGREGQITFGSSGSPQAEIMTSITELQQLRNEQMKQCTLAVKDGSFFIQLGQGGSAKTKDGARVAGALYFASDCSGNLLGDKPGWFPAVFIPHPDTPGVTPEQANPDAQGFVLASANACQQARKDNLGWLSQ